MLEILSEEQQSEFVELQRNRILTESSTKLTLQRDRINLLLTTVRELIAKLPAEIFTGLKITAMNSNSADDSIYEYYCSLDFTSYDDRKTFGVLTLNVTEVDLNINWFSYYCRSKSINNITSDKAIEILIELNNNKEEK